MTDGLTTRVTGARSGAGSSELTGLHNRRLQAVIALIVMLMISPYEYTFTVFEKPIAKAWHAALPQVALTFTIYVVVAGLFMIPSGRWSDRWQPRWFTTAAGVVTGAGWLLSAQANSTWELWLAYGFGALGPGYIYANCVNNALKWFPEARKRGFTVGFIDMGFGAGSALFIPFLAAMVDHGENGFRQAFTVMGIAMLVVIVIAAQFLRYPPKGWLPAGYDPAQDSLGRTRSDNRDYTPGQMLRTWQCYVSWGGLTLITGAGLMVTAHIAEMSTTTAGLGAAVGVAAATYSRIPNGVMRWLGGAFSDRIGRELSMFLCFTLMGLMLLAMTATHNGPLFVVETLVSMGCWGPLFSLYPALVGDYWGRANSGVNYGIVYTGKAAGGVYAGYLAAFLFGVSGSWNLDFYIAAGSAVLAGLSALVLRRPGARTG
ncbi:OFA family MFS transporter [Phaeacidiphilus oryzae]|uniref:OFA family MFS transporter n=1 Tax=Phaeacidiphilus oryzae TaxID=348818 RepID=UPI0005685F30|nr:OFA family MFS transporter [Phaeacidiphilus oryzae]